MIYLKQEEHIFFEREREKEREKQLLQREKFIISFCYLDKFMKL